MKNVVLDAEFSLSNIREFLCAESESELDGQCIVPIGYNDETYVYEDFGSISSALITGTTGSGKTAFIKTIIALIMAKYSPASVRFMIYDSKGIDYSGFADSLHLFVPILTDPRRARSAVSFLLNKAKERLSQLNKGTSFPHIFFVIDDLNGLYSPDNCDELILLLQYARRVNIHLWFATSIPAASVLPTELQANIVCKYVFRVASKRISQMVLDDSGAELLNVPGEFIARSTNGTCRCSAVYFDDDDCDILVRAITETYLIPSSEETDGSDSAEEGKQVDDAISLDPLFNDAVEIVLGNNQASISMIQRNLRCGYARAVHLIDQLEQAGIVSGFDGSKPRQILITRSQWQAMKGQQAVPMSVNEHSATPLTQQNAIRGVDYSIETDSQHLIIQRISDHGTITGSFQIAGKDISAIRFHKPGLFKKGFVSIVFTQHNDQKQIDLQFLSKDADIFKRFLLQLANDIGKPLG